MSTQLVPAETPSLPFGTPVTTDARKPALKAGRTGSSARRSRPQQANVEQVRKARQATASRKTTAPSRRTSARTSAAAQWRLDEGTKQAGRAGIASARQALASARRHQFDDLGELPEAA